MTVGNYVRNLSGPGQVPSRPAGNVVRPRASKPARALRFLRCPPLRSLRHPPHRSLRHPPHRWGLVSCCVGEPHLRLAFGTKFSLLGFLVVTTVQNSPCMSKKRQIEPFRVSRESFVPHMRCEGVCWESFVPHMRCEGVCWESFVPKRRGVVLVGRDLFRRGIFRVCSCRASATHRRPSLALGSLRCAPCQWRWGVCAMRSAASACCRRVAPLMLQFPPLGGGAPSVRGGGTAYFASHTPYS